MTSSDQLRSQSTLGDGSSRLAEPSRERGSTVHGTSKHGHHDAHDHHHGDDHHHDHDDHGHDDHDHDDHGHDHAHSAGGMDAVRIGVAFICAVLLWFEEAFFLPPGSVWQHFHDFVSELDPWKNWALVDLLPETVRGAIPPSIYNWVDAHVAGPFSWIALIGLIFSGWPILKEAFHDLREWRMTMELSMTIALTAALVSGNFFVTMVIVFFVLIAEILEGMTVERGRRAIRELLEFLPRNVTVRRGGALVEVDTDRLEVGETVLVAPGGRIPVDGAVAGGQSFVDESRITGESMPVEKLAGARVYAGSINQSGALEVRVQRIGADTSYGKIIEAVEKAERSRAPVTRTADRLAGYIVIFAMVFAAFTQLMWHDPDQSIAVLVVAGACGVAAGTQRLHHGPAIRHLGRAGLELDPYRHRRVGRFADLCHVARENPPIAGETLLRHPCRNRLQGFWCSISRPCCRVHSRP